MQINFSIVHPQLQVVHKCKCKQVHTKQVYTIIPQLQVVSEVATAATVTNLGHEAYHSMSPIDYAQMMVKRRNYRCLSNEEYLAPFVNQMNFRASLHTGHGYFP